MNFRLPFLKKRKPSWRRVIGGFFAFSSLRQFIDRHRYHRRKIAYFSGALVGISGFTIMGLQTLPISSSDVLEIPSQYNNPVRIAATQQQLHSYLWYPMRVCYAEAPCSPLQTNLPVGWPNSTADSTTMRDFGASNVIWGVLPLYGASTPADPNIVALLDWAASVGMKVNLDDESSWWYISKNVYNTAMLDAHIKRLVQLYGSHPGLAGWYTGNEPEGWGSTAALKESMYARYAQIMALYRQYDPNHEFFSSTASASKLRFCREGLPTHLHNSGFSTFRDANPLVDETSQEYQDMIDRTIYNFDEDYLCTENYQIPVNYSLAANFWEGDVITAAETNMYSYLMLAHGGQGIEWFPYSTDGGLVWDNQAPAYSQNFANWLPAMHGGLIYLDSKYRNVTGFANVNLATDSSIKHSGGYAARMDFSGSVFNYYNLRLNPTANSKNPWNVNFPALKTNTSYTLKGWVKISGDANVQLTATGPGFNANSPVSGVTDWVEVSKTFTTPATSGKWAFGPLIASATNGSVWFDDLSLVETADSAQRNLVAKFNPGFETVTGADRSPHEPLYSAARQVNSDFSQLNIFTQLKHIITFDDLHVPTTGLVASVSSSVSVGLPRVETGVFATAASNADYYLVLVNRNISSSAQISLNLRSANTITVTNLVTGAVQSYSSNGSQVPVTLTLPAGGGRVFRLQGVAYNDPRFTTTVYSENFEDSLAQNWSTSGGSWSIVDDNGSKVYDINATSDARGMQTGIDVADFEYSGKFKIMSDHNSASILHFTFRKDPNNPNLSSGSYNFRIQLDPGAESSTGYVQLVRTSLNSAVICQVNDENFLRGDRYIDFKIRAVGNVFESWFDGIKYATCIDNSNEAYTTGQVGFRIYSGGHIRLDDIAVKSLDTIISSCQENWSCSAWGACVNSQQSRTCVDLNNCGTTTIMPALTQSCVQADTVAPNAVSNLSAGSATAAAITLQWTAPGDDGTSGTASSYDLRYSTSVITAANFAAATSVTGEPAPAVAGSVQSMTVSGLSAGTTYYFALKTSDESLNSSAVSNVVSGATSAAACVERWGCSAWSSCNNNQQTRSCTDSANCGTTVNKPATVQSCTVTPNPTPTPGPGTSCTENWVCNDWSSCLDDEETRTCTDLNHCNANNIKNEKRSCQGDRVDTTAPTTSAIAVPTLINKNWVKLSLSGQDNQTASAKLRFSYSLNGGPKRISSGPTIIVRNLRNGVNTLQVSALDEANNEDATPAVAQLSVKSIQRIITIPSTGGPSLVRVFDYLGNLLSQFHAFPAFRHLGGSIALIDTNNDGPEEIAVASGRGGKPEVKLFDQTGKFQSSFMAYPERFRGGVNVAAADMDGDGINEIITAPASGTGPLLRVFTPAGTLIAETSAFDIGFTGGVTLTAGLTDLSGHALLAVAPASNGQPIVRLFALENGKLVLKTTTEIGRTNQPVGVSLAVSSVNGKEQQVIASFTEGKQEPKVLVLSSDLSPLKEFAAGSANFLGGLRVAAGDIQKFDNQAEIMVSAYSNSRQKMQVFSLGSDMSQDSIVRSFTPYGWSRFGLNVIIGNWQ